jgi:hypothetical protein
MLTREQRIRDREVKRILHEEQLKIEQEQLAKLSEGEIAGRISERQLKADLEHHKRELENMGEDEEDWFFDCAVCGVHGYNLDDGTHSIACEECSVWQHSACHGIDKERAASDDFHFVCRDCKRKAEKPTPVIKIKFSPKAAAKAAQPKPSPAPNTMGATAPAMAPVPAKAKIEPVASILTAPAYPGPPPAAPPRPYQPPVGVPISAFLNSPTKPDPPASQARPSSSQTFTFTAVQPNGSPARQPFIQSLPSIAATVKGPELPSISAMQLPPISPPRPTVAAPQQTPATSFVSATPYSRNTSFIGNGHGHGHVQTPFQTPGPSVSHQTPHSALPAPHLPSPKPVHTPQMAQGSFSSNQSGLEGSSPGYSPMKQVSPPRPSSSNGGIEKKLSDRPVTLEPHHIAPIRSPPVKKASPMLPPLHQIAGQAMGQPNSHGSSFGSGS